MPYAPTWDNANAQGRLDGGVHTVKLTDPEELADPVNRRLLLTYQQQQDHSSHIYSGAYVRDSLIDDETYPPFDNLRDVITNDILTPPVGTFSGTPPTPFAMMWLWPEGGADEDKIIVSGFFGVGEGKVGLCQKLNGTSNWTDPVLTSGRSDVRAVHLNELRQSIEWTRRGRWVLPIYWAAGIFSLLPDSPWLTEAIGNNQGQELRSIGFAVIRSSHTPQRGPTNVTVRSGSYVQIEADTDCTVELYRCIRPIDYLGDLPTWNEYDVGLSWDTPGGTGAGDAVLMGSTSLTADVPANISGSAVTAGLQAMVDGAQQNFLIRRSDTGNQTVWITGAVVMEFDLNTPPN